MTNVLPIRDEIDVEAEAPAVIEALAPYPQSQVALLERGLPLAREAVADVRRGRRPLHVVVRQHLQPMCVAVSRACMANFPQIVPGESQARIRVRLNWHYSAAEHAREAQQRVEALDRITHHRPALLEDDSDLYGPEALAADCVHHIGKAIKTLALLVGYTTSVEGGEA